jgi:hypothetical protein
MHKKHYSLILLFQATPTKQNSYPKYPGLEIQFCIRYRRKIIKRSGNNEETMKEKREVCM